MHSRSRPQKILAGLDGSGSSRNGLRWATELARRNEGHVSAVMAWNYPTALLMPVVGVPVIPADDMAVDARSKLDTIVEGTHHAEPVTEQWVVMGSPRTVLTEASQDHDLLVVGRTGQGRIKRLWLGSTTAYCVRHAECPVAVVGESIAPEKRICVAVDGSPSSIEALAWALQLGDDHDVLAVYAHDEWELDELALDDKFREQLDARADAMLVETIEAAAAQAEVASDRVTRQVRQGDPRTTIVDQADPDEMLVLGAQGHSGIARWVLGSLADYAVLHAPGTVVIWR